jgi:Dolichyl-phosphate-mannose-protein mannosyltransferase
VSTTLLLSAYPLFHLLIRLAVSEGLEQDEAEQVLLTQSLALGYQAVAGQPPLYTWLQYFFFAVFGINIFALAALRALLQIVTQVALFRSAAMILGDRTVALCAALSLWLIPQFSVESMRKTHSVLATCLAALLVHALLVVWKSGGVAAYLWLGAILGLGVLAKYNFVIFAAALALAGVSVAPFRRRLVDRRVGLGLAMTTLLVAPHLVWVLHHLAAAATQIGTRMDMWTARQWSIGAAGLSLWSLGKDPFGYLPLVVLNLAVFGRPREAFSEAAAAVARLLERFWLIAFGVLTVAVLVIAMARFHAHWLQPFLVVLPLYMFLRRPSASPTPRQVAIFAAGLGTAMVLLMGWRLVELWAGHRVRVQSRLNTPYPELVRKIGEAGFRDGVIVADNHKIGGNLRFVLQDTTVITTRMAEVGAIVPPGPCLIVRAGSRRSRSGSPDGWPEAARRRPCATWRHAGRAPSAPSTGSASSCCRPVGGERRHGPRASCSP